MTVHHLGLVGHFTDCECDGCKQMRVIGGTANQTAIYFGCWDRPGHYLHNMNGNSSLDVHKEHIDFPWRLGDLDCGLLRNGGAPDVYDGKVYWTCGGRGWLWYAFVWWDNSVDKRGGSNSGIYVRYGGLGGHAAEAFEIGKLAFPKIVARQRQPLILQVVKP